MIPSVGVFGCEGTRRLVKTHIVLDLSFSHLFEKLPREIGRPFPSKSEK